MPRIPYVPSGIKGSLPDEIRARRNGPLLDLDRTLLHNPDFAAGWNQLLGAVRTKSRLPDSVRELAICWVAVCNEAWYEWDQHVPLAIAAGIEGKVMENVKRGAVRDLDQRHQLVVDFTTSLTRHATILDDTFQSIKRELGSDEAVHDLVAVVATYNMVSRYLNALQVGQ